MNKKLNLRILKNKILKNKNYIFIIFVSIFLGIVLLKASVTTGHDVIFHMFRQESTYHAILDGQIVPQVDLEALGGYGQAWNIFYGPLSTYIITFLRIISINWSMAINLFVLLVIIFSGIFMYQFVRKISNNETAGLLSSLAYISAPYFLLDIYIRQSQGEIVAFVFLPLLMLGLHELIKTKEYKKAVFKIVTSAVGLILSHTLSVLIVALFSLLYLILNYKDINKTVIKKIVQCILFICLLSAFFILPLLEAKSIGIYNIFDTDYQIHHMAMNNDYVDSVAISPERFFTDSWKFESAMGTPEDMNMNLGILNIIGLILTVVFFIKSKEDKKYKIIGIVFLVMSLILASNLIPWNLVPQSLLLIQFPYRFMIIAVFASSLLLGLSLKYFITNRNKLLFIIVTIGIIILSNIQFLNFVGNKKVFNQNDYSLDAEYYLNGIGTGEYLPKQITPIDVNSIGWSALARNSAIQFLRERGNDPIILSGSIEFENYIKELSHMEMYIMSYGDSVLELPVIYYPGYKAILIADNGEKITLNTTYSENGLLKIDIPETKGKLKVWYGMSKATTIGFICTISTLFCVVIWQIYLITKKRNKKALH